jgi:hypothetical protein
MNGKDFLLLLGLLLAVGLIGVAIMLMLACF